MPPEPQNLRCGTKRPRSHDSGQLGAAKDVAGARSLFSTLDSRCPDSHSGHASSRASSDYLPLDSMQCTTGPLQPTTSHLTATTLCGRLSMRSLPLEPHSTLLNSLDWEVPAQDASAWLHCQHKHGYDCVMCPLPWPAVSSQSVSSDTTMLLRVFSYRLFMEQVSCYR